MSYSKPLPETKGIGETFWKGLKENQLLIQRCANCNKWIFYPRVICPHCGGDDLSFQKHEGTGEVYSYTVVHKPRHLGFKEEAPYIIALVDLDGGDARMMTNIVGCSPDQIEIGMKVTVDFKKATDDVTLPLFKPL